MFTISRFVTYFERFEAALETGNWDAVRACLSENLRYSVEGVPYACTIDGRDKVLSALQKSTAAFDATMDFRLLEVQSIYRLSSNRIRVDLVSGYGRTGTGSVTAPVTMEVAADESGIVELSDCYDPELTTPALTWIATHLADADPRYI
jgi:hypothetical protein